MVDEREATFQYEEGLAQGRRKLHGKAASVNLDPDGDPADTLSSRSPRRPWNVQKLPMMSATTSETKEVMIQSARDDVFGSMGREAAGEGVYVASSNATLGVSTGHPLPEAGWANLSSLTSRDRLLASSRSKSRLLMQLSVDVCKNSQGGWHAQRGLVGGWMSPSHTKGKLQILSGMILWSQACLSKCFRFCDEAVVRAFVA